MADLAEPMEHSYYKMYLNKKFYEIRETLMISMSSVDQQGLIQ